MLLAVLRLWSRLPLSVLHACGATAGLLAYALRPRMRDKVRSNLEAAGLYSRAQAWRGAAEAGKAAFETPYIWFRPIETLRRQTDWSAVEQAVREHAVEGRGGRVYLTPHLGAFELSARLYSSLAPMTVLYKPPRREDLHQILRSARSGPGLTAVPTDASGVRALLRALRRGEAIGVLPDQVPTGGEGVWAPFFGRPAFTMTLPARLAERSQAAVFLFTTRRRPRARGWVAEIRRLEGRPDPATLNAELEREIRADPLQYYWNYNRYKSPPGVERPIDLPAGGAA